MKKKMYIVPFVETTHFGADVIMRAVGGEASLPNGEIVEPELAPGRTDKAF